MRRQLQQSENDLALLRNNMGFFARSKNADSVRADFESRIGTAEEQVAVLKSRLKLIRAQLAGQQV